MKATIDRMFVAYVKEEVAAGELVTIIVQDEAHIPQWKSYFTDEELDSIAFKTPAAADAGKGIP